MFHRRHRVGEGFERRLFATHHAYVYRHVAAYVFGARVDADVFGVRPEGEFADLRHAILADQRDDVGAGERVRRGVGRKRTRIENCPFIAPDSTTGIWAFSASFFNASQARL